MYVWKPTKDRRKIDKKMSNAKERKWGRKTSLRKNQTSKLSFGGIKKLLVKEIEVYRTKIQREGV